MKVKNKMMDSTLIKILIQLKKYKFIVLNIFKGMPIELLQKL